MTQISIADQSLTFRPIDIDEDTPTGAQLSASAGFSPAASASVLRILPTGELEDIRPNETADLRAGERRFIIVPSDSSFRFTLDGVRFDWPARVITGAVVRKLGQVPASKALYLQRANIPDQLVGPQDLIDLRAPGVEAFVTRSQTWKLNVQGVVLELSASTIVVRDALSQAGFDPDQGWQIFLKVVGQPKRAMALTDTIDLATPGIEKLRLTPKEVNNGEAQLAPRRVFALLEVDQRHLDRLGFFWETVKDGERRWLLIHDYPVPPGYTVSQIQLALEIPDTYPGAQIDMFYVHPTLVLSSGAIIPSTGSDMKIHGVSFRRWSRHRGENAKWNPLFDNVVTHLALVESAIAAEVGQ